MGCCAWSWVTWWSLVSIPTKTHKNQGKPVHGWSLSRPRLRAVASGLAALSAVSAAADAAAALRAPETLMAAVQAAEAGTASGSGRFFPLGFEEEIMVVGKHFTFLRIVV